MDGATLSTRRRLLRACGAAVAGTFAGCSSGASSDTAPQRTTVHGSATGTTTRTATPTPTCREAVHALVGAGDSGTRPADAVAGTVEVSATAENDVELVVVTGAPVDEVTAQLDQAGLRALSISTVEWCSQPLCEARTFVRFRSEASVATVASSFPEAVTVLAGTGAAGDPIRLVYSRAGSTDVLADRLEDGGLDTATAVTVRLTGCDDGG